MKAIETVIRNFSQLKAGDHLFFIDPKQPLLPRKTTIKEVKVNHPMEGHTSIVFFKAEGSKILQTFESMNDVPTETLITQSNFTSVIGIYHGAPVPFFTSKTEIKKWLKTRKQLTFR